MEHTSFAYYKLPNESQYHYLGSNCTPLRLHSLSAINETHKGFLISPFDTEVLPILLISPNAEQSFPLPASAPTIVPMQGESEPVDCTYLHHFKACEELLTNDALQKIVLAHRFDTSQEFCLNHHDLFLSAATAFPKSYVALWHTAESGTWLTITPEVLLENEVGEKWHTVALAGTMPKGECQWSEKNKMEQQFVVDYIASVLSPRTSELKISEVQTIEAAQLLHLRTDFLFTTKANIGEILHHLHPTPAVCGLPKQEAFEAIQRIESNPRKYYAGFSGPLQHTNCGTHLYVTLRCAHFGEQTNIEYYAGGGLIKGSKAHEEWNEVCTKKKTAECIVTSHISIP